MKHAVVLLFFGLLLCVPLLNPGFYTSHDGETHLIRIAYFTQDLQHGQLFPRWQPELNHHLGYPVFTFSYPLPYYLAALNVIVGLSTISSLKAVLAIATVSSALGMAGLIKKITNRSGVAIAAASLFLFTPYRLVDLYVRAALGELVFLAVLPFICFLGLSRRWTWLSVFIGLAFLSHLQLAALGVPIVVLILAVKLKSSAPLISIGFGIGLAAFFWVPAVSLLGKTTFFQVQQFIPMEHLVTWKQLIYSPWGYGFSVPGNTDGLTFQLGIAHWLCLLLATAYCVLRRSRWMLLVILVWASLLLMTSSPGGVWSAGPLQAMQFPWGLLILPLFVTPLFVTLIPKRILWTLLITLAIYTNRNHIRINQTAFEHVANDYFLQESTATATPGEFMPKLEIVNPEKVFSEGPIFVLAESISILSAALIVTSAIRRKSLLLQRKLV